jgi:hypothetical protein
MNDVQFQDNERRRRRHPGDEKGALMTFLNKQGLSDGAAKKLLYGIIILAFLATIYFIVQI